MKKIFYLILPMLFIVGMSNVRAEALTKKEMMNLIMSENASSKFKEDGFIINDTTPNLNECSDAESCAPYEYIFHLNLLDTDIFSDISDEEREFYVNYVMNVKYENGILSYINSRDESGFTDIQKTYAAMYDEGIFIDIIDVITKNYLGTDYSWQSFDTGLGAEYNTLADHSVINNKYGINYLSGGELNYSQNQVYDGIEVNGQIEAEKINSFSIDMNKLINSLNEIKKSMKKLSIDNKNITVYNVPEEIKEYKYAYDCGGNLTILLLTKDLKLYATEIDGFKESNPTSTLFEMKKVKNESEDKITNITTYNIDDYYKKQNKQKGSCTNQNLAIKYDNGKIKALELNSGYYLNLSVDCIEEESKTETTTKETTTTSKETTPKTVKNPKTGVNVSYAAGIVLILISLSSLLVLRKKKILSK